MLKMTNGKEISKPINSNCNFVDVFVCIGNKEFDLEKLKEKVFSSTGEYPNDIKDISASGNGDVLTFWTGEQENITQWFCTRNNWPTLIEDPSGMFNECIKLTGLNILGDIHINGEITDSYEYVNEGNHISETIYMKNTITGIDITRSKSK